MKSLIASLAITLAMIPAFVSASDNMNREQRQAAFCDKTYDGKNLISGVSFKVYVNAACDTSVLFLTSGKNSGKKIKRSVDTEENGHSCLTFKNGRKVCNTMVDMGDGTYHATATNGKNSGKHYVTLSNGVAGRDF